MLATSGFRSRTRTNRKLARFSHLGMSVVFSIIRLFPLPKQRAQLIEILQSVRDLTRPATGCVGCWLSDEEQLHNHVRYAEQWDSEEALHEHIRSDLYRRVLAAMELSKRPPEISFHYTSETKGFELIENLRRQAKWPPGSLGLQGVASK